MRNGSIGKLSLLTLYGRPVRVYLISHEIFTCAFLSR